MARDLGDVRPLSATMTAMLDLALHAGTDERLRRLERLGVARHTLVEARALLTRWHVLEQNDRAILFRHAGRLLARRLAERAA